MVERTFTREQLSEYDGRDGGDAFVAFDGKVYDVTDSVMWVDGDHEGEHRAGVDLTEAMVDAPHGPEDLEDFPVVGMLVD